MKLSEIMVEQKWTKDVEPHWKVPEGFFTKPAAEIASGLKSSHKSLKSAMGSLVFFMNRAGKNLSADDVARLELAKKKLKELYT